MTDLNPDDAAQRIREVMFKKVWQATHRDYRGRLADGALSLMSYAKFGGGLVTAATIGDDELIERFQEQKRLKAGG